jgi:hypothetical protein
VEIGGGARREEPAPFADQDGGDRQAQLVDQAGGRQRAAELRAVVDLQFAVSGALQLVDGDRGDPPKRARRRM